MAMYYQAVCELEDKFDGLELIHIPKRLNEAADALLKMASQRQAVPYGCFVSDIRKPSIRYREQAQPDGSAPATNFGAAPPIPGIADPESVDPPGLALSPTPRASETEAMQTDQEPKAIPDPPHDWRQPYVDQLANGTIPADWTED